MNLRENEWIALGGWYNSSSNPLPAFLCWYRIVAAGDNISNPDGSTDYYVTLSGPDWPANANTAAAWALAYEKSIVGVYTTTIESGSGQYQDLTW